MNELDNSIFESLSRFSDLFLNKDSEFNLFQINNPIGNEIEELKNKKDTTLFVVNEEKSIEQPIHYSFKVIIDIITKNIPNLPKEIKDSLVSNNILSKIETFLNDSYKKRRKIKTKFTDNTTESDKLGRKRLNDYSERKHNKYSVDNILRKIKAFLLENALLFLNNLLNYCLDKQKILLFYNYIKKSKVKNKEFKNLLKPLDYKYIGGMKKKSEISIFRMPLKDLFAKDISSKYKTFCKGANKVIIDKVLEEEKDNENIMFAFNLTFREWLDIFLYKKELKASNNFNEEKMKAAVNSFNHFDSLLEELYKNNEDRKYFSVFIYLIYNYERWFYKKGSRNRVSKKNNIE
jgi:hypothetical protein